ncbi:MAG: ROK family protein [Ruthenibacterium lactatiformans]
MIQAPPNLPLWDEVPICALLSERYGCPAYLQNDANACAIAEWRLARGAEQGIWCSSRLAQGWARG